MASRTVLIGPHLKKNTTMKNSMKCCTDTPIEQNDGTSEDETNDDSYVIIIF